MSVSEEHLELISAKLNELKQQHVSNMRSACSEPLRVKFNPNQPFKINFFEEYNKLTKEELSTYLKELKLLLLEVLNKMNISALKPKEKDQLTTLCKKLVEPKYYKNSFESFASNLKAKYSSYGLKFNNEEAKYLEKEFSNNKALNESYSNNKIREFFQQINNELSILVLNTEKKKSTFLSNEGIISSEVSIFGVKVRLHKLLKFFKK